jgi:hypothetical protein
LGNQKGLPLLWIPCRLPVWIMTQVNCAITCGRQGSVLVYKYKINKIVELCKHYYSKVMLEFLIGYIFNISFIEEQMFIPYLDSMGLNLSLNKDYGFSCYCF